MAGNELSKDASWNIREEDLTFEAVQGKSKGAGSFGEVFIATWLGNSVAAKRLFKRVWSDGGDTSKDTKPVRSFHREFFLLSLVHHPHIVQLYGVYVPDDHPDTPPVIVMELLDKTLRDLIIKGPRLLLLEVIDYSLQITSALCYLHGLTPPIIHRDLTTNNIMLTSSGVCKIVDLGLAKAFDRTARRELTSRPGNICYMPVEVLNGRTDYDERLDVFSFNIVMLEMCNGRVSQPSPDLFEKLPEGTYRPVAERRRREADLAYLEDSHPLKQLIVSLLQPQESLPPVTRVHGKLHSLRLSDEVARRSREEAQAMRRRFAEKEEASRQEINELKETVHGVHRVMQEMLPLVRGSQVSLRQTQERVEEVSGSQQTMQEALRRTERRVDDLRESMITTTAKVEEGNICQQRMQETLKCTEERMGRLHQSLVTTTGKVKEVSSSQQMMKDILRRSERRVNSLHESLAAKAEESNICQQRMEKTLKCTEERMGRLHESLVTTSGKVKEVSCSQLSMQKTVTRTERGMEGLQTKVEQVSEVQHTLADNIRKLKDDVTQNMAESQVVIGEVQQASRTVQQVAASHLSLQEDLDKMTDDVAQQIGLTQQSADNILQASHEVRQVSDRQGDMLLSLKRVEQGIDKTNMDLTATKEKVEEVAKCQLQKCNRPCAVRRCPGKCIKPEYQSHSQAECSCGSLGCTEDCELCDPGEAKQCRSTNHPHTISATSDEHHDCGQQHRCKQTCEMQGICVLAPLKEEDVRSICCEVGPNGFKLRCSGMSSSGQLEHTGPHKCDKQLHTCEKRCPFCDKYCSLSHGHHGQCQQAVHGQAKSLSAAAFVISSQNKKIRLNPTHSCHQLCQAAGRGHMHIMKCTCEKEGKCLRSKGERRHRWSKSNDEDLVSHSQFWDSFADPASSVDRLQFSLCGVRYSVCDFCGVTAFCQEQVLHLPIHYARTGFVKNGHVFPDSCEDHCCD